MVTSVKPNSGPKQFSALPVIQDAQALSKSAARRPLYPNCSEHPRPDPYNCQGRIVGLVSLAEVVHTIED